VGVCPIFVGAGIFDFAVGYVNGLRVAANAFEEATSSPEYKQLEKRRDDLMKEGNSESCPIERKAEITYELGPINQQIEQISLDAAIEGGSGAFGGITGYGGLVLAVGAAACVIF
jgi:hypothetical protein